MPKIVTRMLLFSIVIFFTINNSVLKAETDPQLSTLVNSKIQSHPGLSGAYVLEHGEDSLFARAWIVENAEKTIDVQYFIWSTDNIGILASEAILSAAERGIKVRVIVDDLLIDAPPKSLVALALHPNISIKIYNPKHQVGTSFLKRLWNVVTNFRAVNQRMHNKIFIVDSSVAITGGRNMADEYFDYDQEYNFRDRDILVAGPVVNNMQRNFQKFWDSELSVSANELLGKTSYRMNDDDIKKIYTRLHTYAADPENYDAYARQAIQNIPERFNRVFGNMLWTNVHFLADEPGKNKEQFSLGGGGEITSSLANLARTAEKSITIQSPYLVMSDASSALFEKLLDRGVKIRINTNSLSASDNLPAYSGYRRQREELLEMGVDIYEFKPYPAIRKTIMQRHPEMKEYNPVFAIHAKTMVVDSEALFIGTYNLDPRSENLNTEIGVLLYNKDLAQIVEKSIERDMQQGNSWNARVENGDNDAGLLKRTKSIFWQLLPLDAIL